jgi:archaellum component FlaF (FlaF/FlaG flagellin family)
VKNLRKSWKVVIPVVLAVMLIFGYAVRSRAFTLIESQPVYFLPYVFSPNAIGVVKITNISDVTLSLGLEVLTDEGAAVTQTVSTATLLPAQTFSFRLNTQPKAVSLRQVVVVSGGHNPNSTLAELQVFNANGQLVELLPAVQLGL